MYLTLTQTVIIRECEGLSDVSDSWIALEVTLLLKVSCSLHRVALYSPYVSLCVLCVAYPGSTMYSTI